MKNKFDEFDNVVPEETVNYYQFVTVTCAENAGSLYGIDNIREKLHAEMCDKYELTIEETKHITNNLDRFEKAEGYGSNGLHRALNDLAIKKYQEW